MLTTDLTTAIPALRTLREIGVCFWSYRVLLISGALIGMVIGVAIALTRPTVYTAKTTLLFPAASSGLGGLTGLSSAEQMPSVPLLGGMLQVPRPGTNPKTAMLLLESWPVREAVVKQQELVADWQLEKLSDAHKQFVKQLKLKDGTAGDLRITFTDASPQLAHDVVVALVEEMEHRATALGMNPAEASVDFLAAQLDDARTSLVAAQKVQQRFEQQHGVVELTEQQTALARQYTGLQDEIARTRIEAELAARFANLRTASAQQLIKECIDPALDSTLSVQYQQVEKLQSDLTLLRDKFTPTSPEYQELHLQLSEAKRRLAAEIERQLALVNSGTAPVISTAIIDAALKQARLQRLMVEMTTYQRQISKFPGLKSQYLQLALAVETQVGRVKLLQSELEKARIIAKDHGPLFVVIEPARVPEEPQPRRRAFIVLVAIMLGGLLAAVIPYLKWQQLQGRDNAC